MMPPSIRGLPRCGLGQPLGELDRDAAGSSQEDELPVVERHDLVAEPCPARLQLVDHGVDVVDTEAHVVEPRSSQVASLGVDLDRWVVEPEELHLLVRIGAVQSERHVVGSNLRIETSLEVTSCGEPVVK